MNRLTQKDDQGNWSLKGVAWESLYEGQVVTKELRERLYGALWKLMEYEDTGLTPEEVEQLKESKRWIPVEERLPEDDGFYIATLDGEICGEEQPFAGLAEFENGKWVDDEEDYRCIFAWIPLPEPYKPDITNSEQCTISGWKERMVDTFNKDSKK
ncbi:MAG: DUF551 domain-containing protein [Lachnospiraceae bacterium]|jgi:hypothetical protein